MEDYLGSLIQVCFCHIDKTLGGWQKASYPSPGPLASQTGCSKALCVPGISFVARSPFPFACARLQRPGNINRNISVLELRIVLKRRPACSLRWARSSFFLMAGFSFQHCLSWRPTCGLTCSFLFTSNKLLLGFLRSRFFKPVQG